MVLQMGKWGYNPTYRSYSITPLITIVGDPPCIPTKIPACRVGLDNPQSMVIKK